MTLYIDEHAGKITGYSVMAIRDTIGRGRTPRAAVKAAHETLVNECRIRERLMIPLYATMKKGRTK